MGQWMQQAGRLTNRGAILLWVPVVCREAQTPEEDRKGLEERGSHPSARQKGKPPVTVAQDCTRKCAERTETDFTLPTSFLVALIIGKYFLIFILSSHLLLLLGKI